MAPVIIKPKEAEAEAMQLDASTQLPMRKRKKNEDEYHGGTATNNSASNHCISPPTTMPSCTEEPPTKIAKTATVILPTYLTTNGGTSSTAIKKARETRLEQNRKAARESRRRKKVMIEDLQRSVIFFSRANGTLKHQNDELTRLAMQAQAQVSVIESTPSTNANATISMNNAPATTTTSTSTSTMTALHSQLQQQQEGSQSQHHPQTLQAASSETNESPMPHLSSNDAKPQTQTPALPTTTSAAPTTQLPHHPGAIGTSTYAPVPIMQPGATMQAMASFQQAAAAAMQVAVQGMQGISPGASLTSLAQPAPTTGSASAQQAYNDTMTALAMQQAAIAAAAVPPHLMAQIVGSAASCNGVVNGGVNGWAVPPPASIAPTLMAVAPATILPAATQTTTQAQTQIASNATNNSSLAPAVPDATGNTYSKARATPVPVAPMPSPVVITTTQGAGVLQ